MNNATYFHECYGMLLILKVLQKTTNKFTINYVKKQGKIEHHQKLHKLKTKRTAMNTTRKSENETKKRIVFKP